MRDKLQIYSVITLFVAILIGFQLTSRMSSSKRLSPADPNSYARPGNNLNYKCKTTRKEEIFKTRKEMKMFKMNKKCSVNIKTLGWVGDQVSVWGLLWNTFDLLRKASALNFYRISHYLRIAHLWDTDKEIVT